ncbi:MAG: hypothetical protein L6Q95_00410 [Planctomycetes bacterium]|nr:hypothetical protein [Planctomycetota bacterium]
MRRIGLVLALCALGAGCARYYKVTDPRTRDVYYTRDVSKRDSGAAEFADARTRAKVTLQSSVIERMTKAQFKEAVGE